MTELEAVARMRVEEYDPGLVIGAVNALVALGKPAALTEVGATQAPESGTGLFWVLRVLFDVPDPPGFPIVQFGSPLIGPPRDASVVPRYPILVVHDVPLFVAGGYVLRGLRETVDVHVAFFREHGTIRAEALSPSSARDAVEAEALAVWARADGPDGGEKLRRSVAAQLARMN